MNRSPRLLNITQDQIRQVLNEHSDPRSSSRADYFDLDENRNFNRAWCRRLHASVKDPVGHFSRIDRTFAPLVHGLNGKFKPLVSKDVVRTTLLDFALRKAASHLHSGSFILALR